MKRALRYIWAVYFLLLFILFFLLFFPFFLIFLQKRKWYPIAHRLRAVWGIMIMYLSGLFPLTKGKKLVDRKNNYVFVANHFSYLDILSLNVQVPGFFRFMAKSELGNIPLFKIFFRTIDISVDRKSIKGAHRAYLEANRSLEEGMSLGVFPEGGILTQVPQMGRFKSGAFKLAIENSTPVVPVAIIDNWKRLPDGGLSDGGTPGRMRVVIHPPIPTNDLSLDDLTSLSNEVHAIIQKTFDSINFANDEYHS